MVYEDCMVTERFFNVSDVSSRSTTPARYFRQSDLIGPKGEQQ